MLLVLVLAGSGSEAGEPGTSGAIAIVVGSGSPIRHVTLDTLRELYLRRQRVWPNGERANPVNLPADDAVRGAFSKRVLGRLPTDLESYWRRMYFEGIRPPLVLKTPRAVCAYVAAEHSAIGYIRLEEVDRESCRVLFVLTEEAG